METVIEHSVEPNVAMPAPRRAGLPLRVSLLLAVAMLLLAVFIAGSGRALWEGVKLSWLAEVGHRVTGHIIEVQLEPAAEKGQTPRQVAAKYACDIPAASGILHREGWISFGAESGPGGGPLPLKPTAMPAAPTFQVGQEMPVRYMSWFGQTVSHPWLPNPSGRILTLFLSGSLVMLVSLLLFRRLWCWMQERLHLLRQGTATVGTITHKRSEAEDMVRYFLRYGYSSGFGEGKEHEEQVSADQWKLFHVGQPVTVLFDPDQPKRVGLYALITHR